MLSPVWDEAADKAIKEFPEKGKVVFGKVDCDKESKYLFGMFNPIAKMAFGYFF